MRRIPAVGPIVLVVLVGCSGNSEQTNRAYNALGRGTHLDLVAEGYVVGIEKYRREEVGNPAPGYPDRFEPLPNSSADDLVAEQNREFLGTTDDHKAMVVTHIAAYFPARGYLYNAYSESLDAEKSYEDGYAALSALGDDIRTRMTRASDRGNPYSHLLIISMGWNNDQYVSIYRYNKILDHLIRLNDGPGKPAFRPLVIGLTWPSAWFTIEDSWLKKKIIGHIGSYTNKSNDSDEIGYTIANWLINRELPEIRESMGAAGFPTVVAVGHSMGARLLSRAIFSRAHLADPPSAEAGSVDMFIGLQGAFSARRFVAEDSGEGAPYRDHAELSTGIVLTSSENDKANPFAFWSKHVGGKNGLDYMKSHPEVFDVMSWPEERERVREAILAYGDNGKVVVLDVKAIVTGDDAHNDILDRDIAELIDFCIGRIE